jgi:hypothetical protein
LSTIVCSQSGVVSDINSSMASSSHSPSLANHAADFGALIAPEHKIGAANAKE